MDLGRGPRPFLNLDFHFLTLCIMDFSKKEVQLCIEYVKMYICMLNLCCCFLQFVHNVVIISSIKDCILCLVDLQKVL